MLTEDQAKALGRLRELLDLFTSGTDRSMNLVGEIEGIILTNFRDDADLQDLLHGAAAYQPGGGDHLHDEQSLLSIVRYARAVLHERGP